MATLPPPLVPLEPMLLDERPMRFDAPGWVWEIKFDGYRMMAHFGGGACQLLTRNGADATKWFPEVARSLAEVPGGPYICDGEACALDDLGRSDFNALQDRARRRRWFEGARPVTYCVFDLLASGTEDLTGLPLLERKEVLAALFPRGRPGVLPVGHFDDHAEELFRTAVHQLKLEGLVAKRAASPYQPGVRSTDWVKVKRKGAIPPERFKRR